MFLKKSVKGEKKKSTKHSRSASEVKSHLLKISVTKFNRLGPNASNYQHQLLDSPATIHSDTQIPHTMFNNNHLEKLHFLPPKVSLSPYPILYHPLNSVLHQPLHHLPQSLKSRILSVLPRYQDHQLSQQLNLHYLSVKRKQANKYYF